MFQKDIFRQTVMCYSNSPLLRSTFMIVLIEKSGARKAVKKLEFIISILKGLRYSCQI